MDTENIAAKDLQVGDMLLDFDKRWHSITKITKPSPSKIVVVTGATMIRQFGPFDPVYVSRKVEKGDES